MAHTSDLSPGVTARAERAFARGAWSRRTVWGMLASRTVGFGLCQASIALIFWMMGVDDAWQRSAAWWPITASVTSAATFVMLVVLLRREGRSYRELLRFHRGSWPRDLLLTIGLALLAGGLAVGPNLGLSLWLYGDPLRANELFLQPLPTIAIMVSLVAFPVTVAASELPIYAGYVQPRLEVLHGRSLALVIVSGGLALQHVTLPLLLDWRFALWRALMFLPFAALALVVLRWRPRLLPYLVVVHVFADLAAVAQVPSGG